MNHGRRTHADLTEQEIQWVKDNWLTVSSRDMGQKLKLTEPGISYLKRKYNLPFKGRVIKGVSQMEIDPDISLKKVAEDFMTLGMSVAETRKLVEELPDSPLATAFDEMQGEVHSGKAKETYLVIRVS